MPLCMKKSIITTIIAVLSFIVTISLISATAYAQQQEQQRQDQAAYFIVQNTSKSMQDPLQGNESSQTQLEIKRSGSQPSTKGSEGISRALYVLIHCSRQKIQHERSAPVSPLSLAPVLHGTPIH